MKRKFWIKLEEWQNKYINTPLMVVGARQIGKTYLINEFCKKHYDDYIYINLIDNSRVVELFEENIDVSEKISKLEIYLNRKINENTIIFFDEIQESESLISSLKYFCESDYPYKIICAGSLLGVKLRRFKKSFPVGKVRILNMYPMDFEEFLYAIGYDNAILEIRKCFNSNQAISNPIHEKLLNYYRLYLCVGGMPASVKNLIDNDMDILKYDFNILSSIVAAYLADMKKYTINNYESTKIERIYKNIPSQLAKENKKFQYNKIEKNARKRDYESSLDWLLSSNMITICNYVNKFETPLKGFSDNDIFKLYLSDVGILSMILEIPYSKLLLNDDFMYKGVIAENYVAEQLIINGYSLYYWSKPQVAEIDFILDTNDGIIPLEVKSNDNVSSKSLNHYIKDNNPNYSIRISTKNFGLENKIKSVPLYAVFCIGKEN